MKQHTFFWRVEHAACAVAAFVLVPLALVTTWLARLATRGQERAEIQLLYARARRRAQLQRPTGAAR